MNRPFKKYQVMCFPSTGESCTGVDFSRWDERYRKTLKGLRDGFLIVVVRVKIPMWRIDGRRAPCDEHMAVWATVDDAIAYIDDMEGGAK